VRHLWWVNGFERTALQQRRTLEMLERDPVPLIVGLGGRTPYEYFEPYDQVHPYVMNRYREYHPVLEENLNRGLIFWVLVDSRREPAGRYELLDLPCFR